MRVRVCSGFSPSGRLQYGMKFLETFDRHWDDDVELRVYVEEQTKMPRGAQRILWDIPGAREFSHRHRSNLAAQGRVAQPCWKDREVQRGYSFRTDAYKFFKQILIPQAAALDEPALEDGDILVWLDGDVETHRRVSAGFVERTLDGKSLAFIGRAPRHSEIGYWAIRLSAATRLFLHEIADWYTSDAVFSLPQWHSAFVWDKERTLHHFTENNLNPKNRQGHVWPLTVLAGCMDHKKGPRKGGVR